MKKIIFPLLLLSISASTFSQKKGQQKIDSLVAKLPYIKNDTLKGRVFKAIEEEYFFIDTDKALYFSKLGLQHVTKMNWSRGIAVFNSAVGRAYSDKSNYDSCIFYYNRALEIHKKSNDYWNVASVLNNIGAAEENIKSDYIKASKYYFEALKVTANVPDKYIEAVCLDNISSIYLAQKNYPKSLEYAFRSLKLREKLTKIEGVELYGDRELGNSLTSIGNIYVEMKDYANARTYLERAIKLHQKIKNNEGLAKTYSNLAVTFGNDYVYKINLSKKAKTLWDKVNPNHVIATNNMASLGVAYLDFALTDSISKLKNEQMKMFAEAEKYLKEAIVSCEKTGKTSIKAHILGNLAELQALKGDYKNAYLNFRLYQTNQDSLYSQQNKNEIAGLESKREIELRDKEIQLNKLDLENQKKQRMGLFIGLVLLAGVGGIFYWQNQTRKKTNATLQKLNEELEEANKLKTKFFAILSHDLRSPVANLISFLNLQKNAPELLTTAIKEKNEKKITKSAVDLLETMESMLLWSKGQMENFKPQIKELAVSDLFEYIDKFFSGSTNVTFSFENSASLSLNTDADYLKTIMQNLTSNAIKALKNTPNAHIIWKAKQTEDKTILAIIDNGEGITEQQLEAFYSENSSIGSKNGFGLYLIKDLAKAISCEILGKSKPNIGTEFQLVFDKCLVLNKRYTYLY